MKVSLARVHTITAALLGASLVAIALDVFAVRNGRPAYVDTAFLAHTPFTAFVAVILGAHVGIAIALERRGEAPRYRTRGLSRFQYGFLGLTLGFIVVHLAHTWDLRSYGAVGFYDALMRDLGAPFYAGVYLVGVTAACFAFAMGGDVIGERGGLRTERQRAIIRGAAILIAVVLWVALFDATSHFVVGRAVLFGPRSS